MSGKIRKGQATFVGDTPMQLVDADDDETFNLTVEQRETIGRLGKAVRGYLKAAKDLLNDKYAHLRDLAPQHLIDPGNVFVACCPGGAVIRYEKKIDSSRVVAAWLSEDLPNVARVLSQDVVQCHPSRGFASTVETSGIGIKLSASDPTASQNRELFSARIWFDAGIERPDRMPVPPQKPFCLLSVRNTLEVGLMGEIVDEGRVQRGGQSFYVRTSIRLPVGWECIEIYPFLDLKHWKAQYSPVWAENDILAAVVARQHHEAYFQSLDPNAEARRRFAKLLEEFRALLDSEPDREEHLQSFLLRNPSLLCPTYTEFWPKLGLGAHKTDFVFRDATSDYLLVELERSTQPLFRRDGQASSELNHARGQITDWKRYLEDNLTSVQRELRLTGISSNPRSLIVIGRSRVLTPENRRILVAMENEHPKLRIMTYDDVYENAKAVIENLLGPIWDTGGTTRIYYLKQPLSALSASEAQPSRAPEAPRSDADPLR